MIDIALGTRYSTTNPKSKLGDRHKYPTRWSRINDLTLLEKQYSES